MPYMYALHDADDFSWKRLEKKSPDFLHTLFYHVLSTGVQKLSHTSTRGLIMTRRRG